MILPHYCQPKQIFLEGWEGGGQKNKDIVDSLLPTKKKKKGKERKKKCFLGQSLLI